MGPDVSYDITKHVGVIVKRHHHGLGLSLLVGFIIVDDRAHEQWRHCYPQRCLKPPGLADTSAF